MTKAIKPLSEQIEEYKLQFKLYQELKQWKIDNPHPQPTWGLEYHEWEMNFDRPFRQSLANKGYMFVEWNWDDDWDGQLIKDVQALEKAGFTIVSFSRKRKITLKSPIEFQKRDTIVYHIVQSVGDSWYSISFKPTLSIYWKGRSSNYRY